MHGMFEGEHCMSALTCFPFGQMANPSLEYDANPKVVICLAPNLDQIDQTWTQYIAPSCNFKQPTQLYPIPMLVQGCW